jgi:hypothetical protein
VNCPACSAPVDFSALTRIGRTKGFELRQCACGAPVAAPIVRRVRAPGQLITASSSRCFRACPRKYFWTYVRGLRPLRQADALRFGTLWHYAMEFWWRGGAWSPQPGADPYDLAKARALFAGYSARWSLANYEVLAIERPFVAPLRDGAGKRIRGWSIAGKVDGLIKDLATGEVWLLEHKTASDDLELGGDYWARLAIDSQISIYHDGAEALGHPVAGCLYDVVRKPGIRPGQVPLLDEAGEKVVHDAQGQRVRTKTGTWRQTGDSTLGYTVQARPESPEEYEARCLEAIAKDPNGYLARTQVVRLDGELAEARADLTETVRGIEACTKRGRWPRNDQHCFEWGRCSYWGLCAKQAAETDYQTITDVHPELKEASNG